MNHLHVAWEVGAEDADGRVGIFTVGKWGSENTPVTIAHPVQKKFAWHIVELHNRTLK